MSQSLDELKQLYDWPTDATVIVNGRECEYYIGTRSEVAHVVKKRLEQGWTITGLFTLTDIKLPPGPLQRLLAVFTKESP